MLCAALDWLNRNSPALQAIGVIANLLVAAVTISVLVRTYRAANKAARAAEEQAAAAKAQVESAEAATDVAREQLAAAKDSAEAEREHSELIRFQLLASMKPALIFVWKTNPSGPAFPDVGYVVNQSLSGIATDVTVSHIRDEINQFSVRVESTMIGPQGSARLEIGRDSFARGLVKIEYRSDDGRLFLNTVTLTPAVFTSQNISELSEEPIFSPILVSPKNR